MNIMMKDMKPAYCLRCCSIRHDDPSTLMRIDVLTKI